MTETDDLNDLTTLRSTVAQLDQYEKLALAAFLVGTSNPKFPGFTMPEDGTVGTNLAKACDLARTFPNATKIFFAIELLQFCQDKQEAETANCVGPDFTGKIASEIADHYGIRIPEEWE